MTFTHPIHGRSAFPRSCLTILTALFLLLAIAPARAGNSFHFLTVSDVPYSAKENYLLGQTLVPAIMKDDAPFVIHMGDFKGSRSSCTTALMTERRDQILSLHPGRVFYTPGDNDWTDCDRKDIPERFSELNRLDLLRRLFYGKPMALPAEWLFARQDLFPENMRWSYQNVVFATVHLVSTNNGRQEILLDDSDLALTLTDARDRADQLWLDQTFRQASKQGATAIVIATQADVTQIKYTPSCTASRRRKCNAFAAFLKQLKALAGSFGRPVLLVHGDTHPYCLDKTFGGAEAPNLWSFNSTGDYSFVDSVRVTVDPENKSAPFSFLSLMRKLPPMSTCESN